MRPELPSVIEGWANGGGPLYARLADTLRSAAERGDISSGTRLPPERALAELLSVSRSTVVAAYDQLREEGWLRSRQGSGTWITHPDMPRPVSEPSPIQHGRTVAMVRSQLEAAAGAVDFAAAALPATGILTADVLADASDELAKYTRDAGYRTLGTPPLRRAIAQEITRWGLPTSPGQVLVTSGAQQAIHLVAMLLVRSGDAVVLEDPTYVSAIDIFSAAGARLSTVPCDREGVCVDPLHRVMAQGTPSLVFLVPTFHNPTGTLLAARRRADVARLAARYHVPVIDDASLTDLGFAAEPPPPLATFDANATVFTIGSLSKVFWGGLRIGWLRVPEHLIAQLERIKLVTDHGSSIPSQVIALRLFARLDEIRNARRRTLAERSAILCELLAERLPSWSFEVPLGGLSLWVKLPYGSATGLARVAQSHGVTVTAGSVFSVADSFDDHLRIPFVQPEEILREGVDRLAHAWHEYQPRPQVRSTRMTVVV